MRSFNEILAEIDFIKNNWRFQGIKLVSKEEI